MLLQFTVGNQLSFREPSTLSMLALPDGEPDDPRVLRSPGLRPVLRTAAIYGANASGKSNLVHALQRARELVLRGTRPDEPIRVRPFKLDASCADKPSSFEFEIVCGSRWYSYGFSATADRVEAEWLSDWPHGVERTLFTREHDPEGSHGISITPALTESDERAQFVHFVAAGTRANQLFLTEVADRNVAELDDLVSWFRHGLRMLPPSLGVSGLERAQLEKDGELRDFLGNFLREAGTGISSLQVRPKLTTDLEALAKKHSLDIKDLASLAKALAGARANEAELVLGHMSADGSPVFLHLNEESDGTRRLLNLAPEIYRLRTTRQDAAIVADELDRSLHTLMSRFFVRAFQEAAAKDESQLIFTTHDTNLLDLNLLRRESIWFVEKDPAGASHLHSLAEFDPEQVNALQSTLERGYLQGRFGAVPFLGDPQRLGWLNAKTQR